MRTGRPRIGVMLTAAERQHLTSLAHRSRSGAPVARRARIILACAAGRPTTHIARRLHVSPTTVCKWRGRFLHARVDGLFDEPRPGTPRKITDAQVEQVIVRTLESTPRGATPWSTRTMARASGLSNATISRIWRAFGVQPHRTEPVKLSPDPLLVPNVRDIVGLYLHPPEHAVVLCVDDKAQIQALDRTAPVLPLRPGQVERRTHDYKRHGTTTLSAHHAAPKPFVWTKTADEILASNYSLRAAHVGCRGRHRTYFAHHCNGTLDQVALGRHRQETRGKSVFCLLTPVFYASPAR